MSTRAKILIRLTPLLIPFAVIFAGGFVLAAAQSFGYLVPVRSAEGFMAGYGRILTDRWFYASFGFSVYVAAVSAALAVFSGALTGYLIWRLPSYLRGPAVVYKVPLILPHIAVAFIILVLFTQSGIISSVSHTLGLSEKPSDFPALLFGGSGAGLIMAYAYKGSAFVILLVVAALKRLDRRLITTAAMLGASRLTVFRRVVLPHLSSVLHSSFIILFLYAFGAFDIPFLLSESRPGMLSIQVFNLFFRRDLTNRPQAMAILVIMFLFSALFIYLYSRTVRRQKGGVRKL